jgi:hypothetical protein
MGEEAFVAFPETVNTALESIELFRVGMWLRLTASCARPKQAGFCLRKHLIGNRNCRCGEMADARDLLMRRRLAR